MPGENINTPEEKIIPPPTFMEGVNKFGLFYAYWSALLGTLIGIGFIIYAIYCAFHKQLRTASVQGTIINRPTCILNNYTYSCSNIQVRYNVDKTAIFQDTGKINYILGDSITLYYDPNNITDISMSTDNCGSNWLILLIAGILIIVCCWAVYYIVKRFAFAQTLVSANFGLNLLRW